MMKLNRAQFPFFIVNKNLTNFLENDLQQQKWQIRHGKQYRVLCEIVDTEQGRFLMIFL
jgi:hypothetical protein